MLGANADLLLIFLQAKLHSWKAQALWAKFDKRASHKCYNRGKACPNTRVSTDHELTVMGRLLCGGSVRVVLMG
jgi:hypothetical protein